MSIWEYANPKKFMETSAWALPWAVGLTVILLVVGYPKAGCQVPVHGGRKKPLEGIAAWL